MNSNNTPTLLREIADVIEQRPDDGYMEFEWSMDGDQFYIEELCWLELVRFAIDPDYTVRRRARTSIEGEIE